jgi:hypothetical protein
MNEVLNQKWAAAVFVFLSLSFFVISILRGGDLL